jgi:hypothetical protein
MHPRCMPVLYSSHICKAYTEAAAPPGRRCIPMATWVRCSVSLEYQGGEAPRARTYTACLVLTAMCPALSGKGWAALCSRGRWSRRNSVSHGGPGRFGRFVASASEERLAKHAPNTLHEPAGREGAALCREGAEDHATYISRGPVRCSGGCGG